MAERADRTVERLLARQSALAAFGGYAFREEDLARVLAEAARVCAEGFGVPYCKVCRHRPERADLVVEAGVGWRPGVVGRATQAADATSPAGRAFVTGEPVVVDDLRRPHGFAPPLFYAAHGVVSTVNVPIKGEAGPPWGVLEIDGPEPRGYDRHDIDFLTGFANILAEAVALADRTARLRALLEAQQAALEAKRVLAHELQHRVRNNLQLVHALLSAEAARTADAGARKGFSDIAGRVLTLARVYDHLLGSGAERAVDFGAYLGALCEALAALRPEGSAVLLAHRAEVAAAPVPLDLDAATALGIAVTELVTGAYRSAAPGAAAGRIEVVLRRSDPGRVTLVVREDRAGLIPAAAAATTKAGGKWRGRGLVARLVRQARGALEVRAGSATTWTITVPVAP